MIGLSVSQRDAREIWSVSPFVETLQVVGHVQGLHQMELVELYLQAMRQVQKIREMMILQRIAGAQLDTCPEVVFLTMQYKVTKEFMVAVKDCY